MYTHYLDKNGHIVDHILALPEQLGKHSSINYTAVINNILKQFSITSKRLGFFITDNASNNDTAIQELSTTYEFNKKSKQIQYSGHILNRVAQSILFSKDKKAFKNNQKNLPVSRY